MGLLDKIKDLFMEEETDEEEIELEEENKKVYEEPKDVLPKVMRDTIKKEEETLKFEDLKPVRENKEEVKKQEEIPQRKFSFPIDFEDDYYKNVCGLPGFDWMMQDAASGNKIAEKTKEPGSELPGSLPWWL